MLFRGVLKFFNHEHGRTRAKKFVDAGGVFAVRSWLFQAGKKCYSGVSSRFQFGNDEGQTPMPNEDDGWGDVLAMRACRFQSDKSDITGFFDVFNHGSTWKSPDKRDFWNRGTSCPHPGRMRMMFESVKSDITGVFGK